MSFIQTLGRLRAIIVLCLLRLACPRALAAKHGVSRLFIYYAIKQGDPAATAN